MSKAFLCHSSSDKNIVGPVARQLGRAKVAFDEFSFEAGQDFRDEIRRHLDQTGLFVFFASRAALDSVWCQFELDQADLRRMQGGIKAQLTLLIDPGVSFSDLPPWLAGSRAVAVQSPRRATREIEAALLSNLNSEARKPFIGRQAELARFARDLVPFGHAGPHILVATGLEGIGRSSLLERGISDNLGLRWGPTFLMDHTKDLTDLYLWLVEETGVIATKEALVAEAAAFRDLDLQGRKKELLQRLSQLTDERTVPCIVDRGGVLLENGTYHGELQSLLNEFAQDHQDAYLSVLLRRRPYVPDSATEDYLALRVDTLSDDDSRLLLTALLRRDGIQLDEGQIQEFVEYLDGYPPAAYFIAAMIRQYGPDAVLANKFALEDFKARRFERYLTELSLTETHWRLLQYLSGEVPLGVETISSALDVPREEIGLALQTLIDLSLVSPVHARYTTSAPVRSAVTRVRGLLSSDTYAAIADRLKRAYWSEEGAPELDVIDATMRASALGSRGMDEDVETVASARISTVQRIAEESYHAGDYERALDYGRRVDRLDPGRRGNAETIYKSLVRLERWSEADRVLREIRESGDRKYHFLHGFGLRRQNKLREASAAFEAALEAGDRAFAVRRELAFCHYALSQYSDALRECKEVLDRDAGNLFLLDLMCQIQLALRDFPESEKALRSLEAVDVQHRFIFHRRATFWAKRGDWDRALEFAELALTSGHAPFEAYAQKVSILIDKGDHESAAIALHELVTRFPRQRHDVQVGLRVKSFARRGMWRDGLSAWEELREKDRPVHQGLRKALLVIKSKDSRLSITERAAAADQADAIAADLEVLEDLGSLLDPTTGDN